VKRIRLFMALFLCSFPALASAQVTGSRLDPAVQRTDPERIFTFMIDCYVKRYTPDAVRFLTLLPGSSAENKRFANITGALEVCLSSRDIVFEGGFLEAASPRYRRALAKTLVAAHADLVPDLLTPTDAKPWFAPRVAGTTDFNIATLSVEEFGDCVARRDWASARAVALAKPKSGAEKRALAVLSSSMGPCVPARQSMTIEREMLAPVVSEAVYHIAVAPTLEARYAPGSAN
jgi:hypothetical protein